MGSQASLLVLYMINIKGCSHCNVRVTKSHPFSMIIGNILEKSASKGKISNPPPEKLLQRHLEKRNAFLENQIKVVLVVAATQVQPSTSVCGPRKLAQIIKLTRCISSLRPKIWSLHQSHTKSLLSVLLPVQSEWLMVDELGLLSLNEARS